MNGSRSRLRSMRNRLSDMKNVGMVIIYSIAWVLAFSSLAFDGDECARQLAIAAIVMFVFGTAYVTILETLEGRSDEQVRRRDD